MTNESIYALTETHQLWGKHIMAIAHALRGAGPKVTSITDTDLKATERGAGANMSVDVAAGSCVIDGTTYTEAGVTNVAIAAADVSLDRYDIIVYDKSAEAPAAVTGTASATPGPPSPGAADDVLLAIVYVAHGATSIANASIFDVRCAGQRYPISLSETTLHRVIQIAVSQSADCQPGGVNVGSGFGGDSSSEIICGQVVIPSDLVPAADEDDFTLTAKWHIGAGMYAGAGTATMKLYDVTDSNELLATLTTSTQDVVQRLVSSALTVGTSGNIVPGHTYKVTVRSSNLNAAIIYDSHILIYKTTAI